MMAKMKSAIATIVQDLGSECGAIDDLPRALRQCVHEFGWSVVRQFVANGVTKPAAIRHLIYSVWMGSREMGNVRQAQADGGQRKISYQVDEFLIRQGVAMNTQQFLRLMRMSGFILIPREPIAKVCEEEGVNIDATRAYIRAAERHLWPDLNDG